MARARNNSKLETRNSKLRQLVLQLLPWFSRNARDLPWRRTRDPYAIWISEIMLQQTQVKTVLPYWRRWMRELPTLRSLAKARPEKVLKLWEGLGYYTRVRNLHDAARIIATQHGGQFPESFEEILALSGIGRYTAGAICSIAFNQPEPILDGNVIRVLTRVFGIKQDPREKTTNAKLWQLAGELVLIASGIHRRARPAETGNCSSFNQALMELGALVCTPKEPACDMCPVRRICIAYRSGKVAQFPHLIRPAKTTHRRFIAFVVENRGRFLVRQRPAGGVNAHLWEFPNVEVHEEIKNPVELALAQLGLALASVRPLVKVRHTITRYRNTLEVFRGRSIATNSSPNKTCRWLTFSELGRLAFPSAHRNIIRRLPTLLC
jgi:A/G-specific adenine glycosylase